MYSRGESEEIVGKALAGAGATTSCSRPRSTGRWATTPTQFGNSRRWIIQEVENSLRRLGTDWIDLYQIHRPEPDTDIDETLGALTDLVRAGKVRYIGSSTFPATQIVEAQWVAERRGRERFVCEQPPYSILVRGDRARRAAGVRAVRHGRDPVEPAGGRLAVRPLPQGAEVPQLGARERLPCRYDMSLPGNQRKLEAAEALALLAEEAGVTLIEMAMAFVIRHPAVTAAIIGPRTMEQLESSCRRRRSMLSDDVLDRIDGIVPPGTNLNDGDAGYENPALAPEARRRGGRSALRRVRVSAEAGAYQR